MCVCVFFRDNNKPINILTGIDYWLDNLMCNVPELVMCFHVNGIVQVNYSSLVCLFLQPQMGAQMSTLKSCKASRLLHLLLDSLKKF